MSLEYGLQWLLLLFFMIPLLEALLFTLGMTWTLFYKQAPEKYAHLIVQVTTVGKEHKVVQRTIDKIRSYGLTMPYEIWIVLEPGHYTAYRNADGAGGFPV
jgi:hypothetical protein